MELVCVHSPLLGPASWRKSATLIDGVVPDLTPFVSGPPPYWARFVERASGGAPTGDVALVAHSGAGPLLPMIAERLTSVTALVFVDAGIPPTEGTFRQPQEFRQFVAGHSHAGRLAAWYMWWEGTLIEELIPNPDDVLALRSDEPRVPLGFYGEVVPVPDRWTERPCGYIRLECRIRRAAPTAPPLSDGQSVPST